MNYIDIVATSSEQLSPSKLRPHHIHLFKNAIPLRVNSINLIDLNRNG